MSDVVRFEKKKLVLPVLMCLVLVSAVYGMHTIRGNGWDETYLEAMTTVSFQGMVFATERTHFNASNQSAEYWEQRESQLQQVVEDRGLRKNIMYYGAPIYAVYTTPFFPLTPSSSSLSTVFMGSGKKADSLIFKQKKGYYLSREVPESLVLSFYRIEKLQEIDKEAEAGNLSLEQYHLKAERLAEKEKIDREVLEGFRNQTVRSETGGLATASGSAIFGQAPDKSIFDQIYFNFKNDRVKEIQWYHFVPSMIATFGFYYLLSGVLIAVLRCVLGNFRGSDNGTEIEEKASRDREGKDSFSREDLTL